jgi:phage shock protein C
MDKKLTRSKNQMIGGVCAGVAEYFDWDVTLVRAAYAILFFFFGVGFLLYLVLWIVMPKSDE